MFIVWFTAKRGANTMSKSDSTIREVDTSEDVQGTKEVDVVPKPARTSCEVIAKQFGKTIVEPEKNKRSAGW